MDEYYKKKILDMEEKINNHDILLEFLISRLDSNDFNINKLPNNVISSIKKHYEERKIKKI